MAALLIPVFLVAAVAGSDYAGSAACRGCHAQEYASQSATAHARALARSKAGQPGEWAFGAGLQAITFVSRADADHYLEHGESWYRRLNGMGLTPGHRSAAGVKYRIFDPSAAMLRCFGCHSTGPVGIDAPAGDRMEEKIAPQEPGVRCEVCHGPLGSHARDPRQARPGNPGTLSAEKLNDFCGECHRMPAAAGSATDLRNPWNARHQPLMLALSACFRKSEGRLTCFTCHAPHAAVEQKKAAAYNEVCGKCHAGPRHTTPVKGRACVECHMPAVRPLPNLSFANHRIGIYGAQDAMSPVR